MAATCHAVQGTSICLTIQAAPGDVARKANYMLDVAAAFVRLKAQGGWSATNLDEVLRLLRNMEGNDLESR